MSDKTIPQLTIKQVAESLRPGWEFKKDWLCWPPDTFALISVIMEHTGCYRHCLIDYSWFRTPSYPVTIYKGARHWLLKTADLVGSGNSSDPSEDFFTTPYGPQNNIASKNFELYAEAVQKFKKLIDVIQKYWDGTDPLSGKQVDLEILRTINETMDDDDPYSELAEALVQLLAMADVACAGMGLLEKSTDNVTGSAQIVHCAANLLLTATGSLSTLPKFHGAVLPKMRTPQGGITPRSLSHHLTFHSSEVEVMWRTIPWSNHHQKSLNIIAVPFPFDISEDNFEPRSERFQSVQYFSYRSTLKTDDAKIKANEYIDKIVDLVWNESKKLDQIHILVFPESALTEEQYTYIKKKFYKRLISSRPLEDSVKDKIHHLPLIVAGVHKDGLPSPYTGRVDNTSHNEVRMATFFAGKWYDVAQRKHHRWHLNRNQLVQYWLAGKLPSERRWFEHISVAQRRLTILAPTGWLALTSLICEDLAQLEPVSGIIRGIGPTFLMALLSDGPQLNSRWSARYANVLADDPGTAVLSLTSLGMVKRSRKLTNDLYTDNSPSSKASEHTIALWKDMLRGQQEINLSEGYNAVRLTISAKYKEEYTLDGRSDGVNASVFELEGYEQLKLDAAEENPNKNPSKNKELQPLEGTWLDIRELTALHFTLDSLIELKGKHCAEICSWIKAVLPDGREYPKAIKQVIKQMAGALKDPRQFGIDATQNDNNKSWPTEDMKAIHSELEKFFISEELEKFYEKPDVDYFEYLFTRAGNMVADAESRYRKESKSNALVVKKAGRKFYLVPFAIMNLVHAKISDWQLNTNNKRTEEEIVRIVKLRKDIKSCLIKNQYINFS